MRGQHYDNYHDQDRIGIEDGIERSINLRRSLSWRGLKEAARPFIGFWLEWKRFTRTHYPPWSVHCPLNLQHHSEGGRSPLVTCGIFPLEASPIYIKPDHPASFQICRSTWHRYKIIVHSTTFPFLHNSTLEKLC